MGEVEVIAPPFDTLTKKIVDRLATLESELKTKLDGVKSELLTKLDAVKSGIIDGLEPVRSPFQILTAESIAGGGKREVTIESAEIHSAIILTVSATYDAAATLGLKIRWLYSPDNVTFDRESEAEAEDQFKDLGFAAGETFTRTFIVLLYQPYVKIQFINKDSTYAVTVNAWRTLLR